MKDIKYIHCFGTSYTAGGGFEFESSDVERCNMLKKYYGNLDEELTQFNFSWPGRLKKLFKNYDIEIINHAKQGYGNERMYRIAYDLINQEEFNSEEHLFLFEFSHLGRKEFWYNDFKSYIIFNYTLDYNYEKLEHFGIAKSWHYDTNEEESKLKEDLKPFLIEFFNKTFDARETINQIERDCDFFVSYLEKNQINHLYTSAPISQRYKLDYSKLFNFGDGKYYNIHTDFAHWCSVNNLTITDETPEEWLDSHNGFIGNEIIAKVVYNKLIQVFNFNLPHIDIDWEYYKNLNKLEFISQKRKVV